MNKVQGFTEQGNTTLTITGAAGTISRTVQGSFPSCTITVYDAGTVNLSTIYSDNSSTSKANPFTAAADGTWFFYVANGRYDVKFSGGGISSPFTLGDIPAFSNSSGTTSAIATGATVTHGLGRTPSQVLVTAADSGPTNIYTSSKGATTFIINYGGGGTHVFDWMAIG